MVHSNGGTIKGRTVVQKLAYFANLRLNVDGVRYRDYYYGPFSREVAIALDNLVSSLFVRETVRSTPIEHYTYELTRDGEDLAGKIVRESPAEHNAIKSVVDTCRKRCSLRARPMSCAAKVHFILDTDPECGASARGIKGMAQDFGWNMTDQEIEHGMALLGELAPQRTPA